LFILLLSTANLTLAPDAPIDLHMHTTFSDGRWPAEQLLDYLIGERFAMVAITDHDRVDTQDALQPLALQKGLPVLVGVEMTTQWNGGTGDMEVMGDLLCYGFDPDTPDLRVVATSVVDRQYENTLAVLEELKHRGYEFPRQAEVLKESGGEPRLPRDNIALLRQHGYASDWHSGVRLIKEAGFVSIKADMAETVEAVHRGGGVTLIAHPGRRERGFTFFELELLDQVRADVPIDGIEVIHPSHSAEMTEAYLAYARKHHLLMSTGSDSHSIPGRMPKQHRAELSRDLLERVGIHVAS
jgi:predicted metal-dependent phosphoesterase TrpH